MTQILGDARVMAAETLADADQRADRAGADEPAKLRTFVEDGIEAMRVTRAQLAEYGDGTASRLRAAASQLEEMSARLAVDAQAPSAVSFDRAFEEAEPTDGGLSSRLAALVEAADEIAEGLAEAARRRAKEVEHAALGEADRIGKGVKARRARVRADGAPR